MIRTFVLLAALFAIEVLAGPPARAQETSGAPDQSGSAGAAYEGFEGRKVSKIEVAAAPGTDANRIRSLVSLKPGDPFSAEQLKSSVAAIQKSGGFTEIQASLEPDAIGVKVVLLLEPVFHTGLISFPGAVNRFPYSTLLQTADIQPDSVFSSDVLPERAAALHAYFVKQGYFEAAVRTRTETDEAHKLVNVIFDCQLAKRAKVGKIVIAGVPLEEQQKLRGTLNSFWAKLSSASVRSGQIYSRGRIEKGMERLRAYYRNSNRIAPEIGFEPVYDSATRRADLHLNVTPGPVLEVKVEGAHLWRRTLRKLVPIFQEGTVDQDLVNEGLRNLTNYFQSKSYFKASVQVDTQSAPDRIVVTYRVDKGKRHRVDHILFTNNKHFNDPDLEARISLHKARFPVYRGRYSEALVKQSASSLVTLYRNEGFASVVVTPEVTVADTKVDIEFVISEGPQDRVRTVRAFNSQGTVPPGSLGRTLQLQPGRAYSAHRLEDDRSQILARYLNRGYPEATLEATVVPAPEDPHQMDVTYRIQEGQLVQVQDVVLLGTEHARPDFVRNITASNVRPGQPLSQAKLFQAESDMYGLGIFDWASVTALDTGQSRGQRAVLVRVHESKRNSLDVGVGLEVIPRNGNLPVGTVAVPGLPGVNLGDRFSVSQKSFVGPRFSMQYARHDIRGRAETAAIGFVLSRLDQRGTFTYADPDLRGTEWSSLFSLTAERTTQNPIFTAAIGQASFQVERQLDKRKTQKIVTRYSYRRTDLTNLLIPELVLPQDRNVRLSTVYAEYVRDTRDRPLDAHRGQFQSVSLGISPKAFGSSADFLRFVGQMSFYTPLRSGWTWANNLRLGLAAPFAGSEVPLSERFFTGGPDTLRGFPINGAGPQRPVQACSNPADPATCTVISVPVGGQMLAILNSEVRFPIPVKKGLGGVVFYDGGNVYTNINARQLVNNYTNSVGLGIRYNTRVGPIRIDIGRNLNPAPGVRATQYYVTLGQAF